MKRKSLPTGRDFLFVEGYGNENPGAFQSPRPLRGATCLGVTRAHYIKFQSTRPLRGATTFFTSHNSFIKISTHAPLAGRDFIKHSLLANISISTHAPLAGRDGASHGWKHRYRHFNPRAPCGARLIKPVLASLMEYFNPRAPCGARHYIPFWQGVQKNFNPRAPCGARLATRSNLLSIFEISTHAPLAGRDRHAIRQPRFYAISTHAPLAGRDSKSVQITMHIFAITDKFQMLLHRMPPVRAFCSFLMQENHADFGCEPPK